MKRTHLILAFMAALLTSACGSSSGVSDSKPISEDERLLSDASAGGIYIVHYSPQPGIPDMVDSIKVSATSTTGEYTFTKKTYELLGNNTWGPPTKSPGTVKYFLTPSGWVASTDDRSGTVKTNGNSILTINSSFFGTHDYQVYRTALDGRAICVGITCSSVGGTYVAGSNNYEARNKTSQQTYVLNDVDINNAYSLVDVVNNQPLLSVPKPGDAFCVDGFYFIPKAIGSSAYNVISLPSLQCKSQDVLLLLSPIFLQISQGVSGTGNMITQVPTGNSVVPNILKLTSDNSVFRLIYQDGMVMDMVDGYPRVGKLLAVTEIPQVVLNYQSEELLNNQSLMSSLKANGKPSLP